MNGERLRIAGWGSTSDGARVIWSIADGRRGRRWREVVARDRTVEHALLFETAPDRRFSYLELAASRCLVSLHPEPDGTIHGNVVDPSDAGVRHVIGMPHAPEGLVIVQGSIIATAALAWQLGDSLASQDRSVLRAVHIDRHGGVATDVALLVERISEHRWRVDGGPEVDVSDDGQPILADGRTSLLEIV